MLCQFPEGLYIPMIQVETARALPIVTTTPSSEVIGSFRSTPHGSSSVENFSKKQQGFP